MNAIKLMCGFAGFVAAGVVVRVSTGRVFVEDMEYKFDGMRVGYSHASVETLKDRIWQTKRHAHASLTAIVHKSNLRDLIKERPAIQTTIQIKSDPKPGKYWEERLWANMQREMALIQLKCMEACHNQKEFRECLEGSDLSAAVDKTFVETSREVKTLDCERGDKYCLDLKKRLEERK